MPNYTYERSHYPNTVSWYRELVWLDGELVGEINEPTDSTYANRIYKVRRYEPLQIEDDTVSILSDVGQFNTVSDCKDYINNGGLL